MASSDTEYLILHQTNIDSKLWIDEDVLKIIKTKGKKILNFNNYSKVFRKKVSNRCPIEQIRKSYG